MIVDDHPVVRSGLTNMLQGYDEFSVVLAANSGDVALKFLRDGNSAGLALLDLRMPGMDSLEFIRSVTAAFAIGYSS